MSPPTSPRRFREATGTTVTQWLNAQRVARAQQLLETTDMPIEAVAGEAGFGTPLGLRQQFGAQLGNTPSHYRRTFREVGRSRPAEAPAHLQYVRSRHFRTHTRQPSSRADRKSVVEGKRVRGHGDCG